MEESAARRRNDGNGRSRCTKLIFERDDFVSAGLRAFQRVIDRRQPSSGQLSALPVLSTKIPIAFCLLLSARGCTQPCSSAFRIALYIVKAAQK